MKLPLPLAPAGLLVLSAVFGIGLLYQASVPPAEFHPPPAPPRPTAGPAVTFTGFVAPPVSNFSEIDERSVFNPQRKPVGSQFFGGNQPETGAPSNLALVGIIMGPGSRFALLKKQGSAAAQTVSVGGTIDGWRVTQIESNYIVLHEDSSNQDVKMPMHANIGTPNTPITEPAPAQEQYAPPPVKGDDGGQ